jgi:hypothetical protein
MDELTRKDGKSLYVQAPVKPASGEYDYRCLPRPRSIHKVLRLDPPGFFIRSKDGKSEIFCLWKGCAFLNGGNWIRRWLTEEQTRELSDGS